MEGVPQVEGDSGSSVAMVLHTDAAPANANHSFSGVMFDIENIAPCDISIDTFSVSGELGTVQIYACPESHRGKETDETKWTMISEGEYPRSWDTPTEIKVSKPYVIPGAQRHGFYIHSILPNDLGIRYNSFWLSTPYVAKNNFLQVHIGQAHTSRIPFDATYGWFRDRRGFTGAIGYTEMPLLWSPSRHCRFPAEFRAGVRTLLLLNARSARGGASIAVLPAETLGLAEAMETERTAMEVTSPPSPPAPPPVDADGPAIYRYVDTSASGPREREQPATGKRVVGRKVQEKEKEKDRGRGRGRGRGLRRSRRVVRRDRTLSFDFHHGVKQSKTLPQLPHDTFVHILQFCDWRWFDPSYSRAITDTGSAIPSNSVSAKARNGMGASASAGVSAAALEWASAEQLSGSSETNEHESCSGSGCGSSNFYDDGSSSNFYESGGAGPGDGMYSSGNSSSGSGSCVERSTRVKSSSRASISTSASASASASTGAGASADVGASVNTNTRPNANTTATASAVTLSSSSSSSSSSPPFAVPAVAAVAAAAAAHAALGIGLVGRDQSQSRNGASAAAASAAASRFPDALDTGTGTGTTTSLPGGDNAKHDVAQSSPQAAEAQVQHQSQPQSKQQQPQTLTPGGVANSNRTHRAYPHTHTHTHTHTLARRTVTSTATAAGGTGGGTVTGGDLPYVKMYGMPVYGAATGLQLVYAITRQMFSKGITNVNNEITRQRRMYKRRVRRRRRRLERQRREEMEKTSNGKHPTNSMHPHPHPNSNPNPHPHGHGNGKVPNVLVEVHGLCYDHGCSYYDYDYGDSSSSDSDWDGDRDSATDSGCSAVHTYGNGVQSSSSSSSSTSSSNSNTAGRFNKRKRHSHHHHHHHHRHRQQKHRDNQGRGRSSVSLHPNGRRSRSGHPRTTLDYIKIYGVPLYGAATGVKAALWLHRAVDQPYLTVLGVPLYGAATGARAAAVFTRKVTRAAAVAEREIKWILDL